MSNKYYIDKDRLMREQLSQQDIQIQFLKEKLARLEVTHENGSK
jgi:hypothetical protein